MRAEEISGLMEAYSHIYSEPELLEEEVEVEEVDMELEEDSESLDEGSRNRFRNRDPEKIAANRTALGNRLLYGNPEGRRPNTGGGQGNRGSRTRNRRSSSSSSRPVANLPADYKQTELAAGAAAEKSRPGAGLPVSGGGNQGSNRPAPRPSSAPAAKTPTKPTGAADPRNAGYVKDRAAISTAKTPEAKAAATKKAEKTGMDAWAKANPKLAAAKAERDRTRGTSSTTNPLMKDMPGRNKAELERVRGNAAIDSISKSPSAKKILSTSKIGQASLNRSQFGSATKPAAPAPKPAAPKPAAATPAPKPAPKPAAPKPAGAPLRKEPLWNSVDIFDIIKGHLLDEGYAETEESAIVIMTNMSDEWRDDIVERYKGKHGQSSDEYKDDRSQGGKMVSGDSKMSGAEYTHGRRVKAANPGSQPDEGGKTKPKSQGKMDKGTRADLEYRKANLKKEETTITIDAILSLLDENREHDREMRRAAARERAEEKRAKKEDGKKSAKSPGRLGKSAGSSYADYQEVSIKAHDKATKGKFIPGMVKNEEVELDENRRAARSAGGYKDDSKKQPDPSKDGFTGIGNMSIKDIMALNKKIQAKKDKKD